MEGALEIQNEDEGLKSQIVIRCARAAMLLSSLKCFPTTSRHGSANEVKETNLEGEAENIRRKLIRERMKNRRMKLWGVSELLLQLVILLSLWTLCLMLLLNFF